MRACKRDANERTIIDALEVVGAFVVQMNPPAPFDLLVGFRGNWFCLEVKQTAKHTLTDNEAKFALATDVDRLNYAIVTRPFEALKAVGATPSITHALRQMLFDA